MVVAQSGSDYPFLDLIWTMVVFFAWVIWFWMLIVIFGDLFRRDDLSGWGKAGWTVLVVFLPFIGVLAYLIVEGKRMGERKQAQEQAAQKGFEDYVRSVSANGTGDGAADEIAKAKLLLDNGTIDEEEYRTLKQRALAR
ncbi:hypothetical protein FPZ12_008805 [Amycolatopsis acidicola]|uniref:Cardiolipin synthase N-terminal domain-containing protein n=1 Tax=Amycolatopsis acidicola TaxID=2596893 RepID=A0A5N0VEL8_9PSEU|nr:SHOCT domain-containing protein [Amycolatopsis acidicola]KAA9163600.1 hypothetical protein FPZ12_008805 [Amycolatopsis acidicola]